ncbi:Protein of unknown function [Desulfosporosinus lacus DSM 15449]|uniref:DUF3102 domain-containing protein n=1 Tax=Desulfosporosinus lacus DSM 15449 TaxID=1121420 RepID=A0A1M6H8S8_9FIRM|nr:Protein of unknown function [Desulfosporosinus lacus DSM 15449]
MEPITERTPLVIAAEINRIKQQTCKIMLTNAIEIGKRLKEAKALLSHGEWRKWLVEMETNCSLPAITAASQIRRRRRI